MISLCHSILDFVDTDLVRTSTIATTEEDRVIHAHELKSLVNLVIDSRSDKVADVLLLVSQKHADLLVICLAIRVIGVIAGDGDTDGLGFDNFVCLPSQQCETVKDSEAAFAYYG